MSDDDERFNECQAPRGIRAPKPGVGGVCLLYINASTRVAAFPGVSLPIRVMKKQDDMPLTLTEKYMI